MEEAKGTETSIETLERFMRTYGYMTIGTVTALLNLPIFVIIVKNKFLR